MPILDFTEISKANQTDGQQDTFEFFARDFLEMLGFIVEDGPDRGQDGGRDIIVIERRKGIIASSEVRWLVSCKHFAHSGRSVRDADEQDLSDRIRAHNASGFIGFYSTVISSPLGRKLNALKSNFEVMIFDQERIEAQLLIENKDAHSISKRYFPISFEKWSSNSERPSQIFEEYEPLECDRCGKDLLTKETIQMSIIVFVENHHFNKDHNYNKNKIEDIYFACKGNCDTYLEYQYHQKGFTTKWEDISDVRIPNRYLSWNMALLNRIRDEYDVYSDVAFEKLKQFILKISQYVIKERTDEQTERLIQLSDIPDYF